MAIKVLDALAIASLTKRAQIRHLAALWCRETKNRVPSKLDPMTWVTQNFGAIIPRGQKKRAALALNNEIKRQIRIRLKRAQHLDTIDLLQHTWTVDERIDRVLVSRLGPARRWLRQRHIAVSWVTEPSYRSFYLGGVIRSGLVAGLIPVPLRLRRIVNPSLLVYRERGRERHAQSRWVPSDITTVAAAFRWLIPPEAEDSMNMPGVSVEHDTERQVVRLITEFGIKELPWRTLV